jgi:excisionase family DNA binding protein
LAAVTDGSVVVQAVTRLSKFDELPEYLDPAEVAAFLGISRNTAYELIRTNAIHSVKFGRLIRVPKAALSR